MKAKFEVNCTESGFSRSYEMPLEGRGYARDLAEDLLRAMDTYSLKVQNNKLRTALEEILKFHFFGDHSEKYRELLKSL